MEENLKLPQLIKVIRKRLLFIVSFISLVLICTTIYTIYVAKPVYEANAQLLVNQKNDLQDAYTWDKTETDLKLINTYYVIVKSPIILNQVIEKLSLNTTPQQLEKKIMITNENNSKVINLTIVDEHPGQAVALANTLVEVFEQQIPSLMNVDNVSVLSPAFLPPQPKPVRPNLIMSVGVAFVLSLIVSLVLVFCIEMFDTTIKNEQQIEELIGLPMMGFVSPIVQRKNWKTWWKFNWRKGVREIEF